MKIFVIHTMARGKDDPKMIGLKLEKACKRQSAAEEYAGTLATGEKIINGTLMVLRVGITELELEE